MENSVQIRVQEREGKKENSTDIELVYRRSGIITAVEGMRFGNTVEGMRFGNTDGTMEMDDSLHNDGSFLAGGFLLPLESTVLNHPSFYSTKVNVSAI